MDVVNRSNIIKRTSATSDLLASDGESRVVKRPVVDARAEARRLLTEAQREAAELRESAQREARELREAAYREGHEAALLELHQLLVDAREERDTTLAAVERDVLRLSVKIAEKIIGREIERDSAALAEIVSTALRSAGQHETLVVRINPSDMPAVRERRDVLDPMGRTRFLDLVADPRVAHGGCIIESASGTVDAQLDTQLRVLERALLERASREGK